MPSSDNGVRIGGWAIMADRVGVEAMCRLGVDFVGVDAQHGFFGFDGAAVAIQVANLCRVRCFVRVPAGQLDWVPRYLDAGADGIVVAMVSGPEEAREAVRLSRYQPGGSRSYGGGPRNGVGETRPGNEAPEILAMVETRQALESLGEIAAVPGLTGIFVGPVDLGMALGRPHPLPANDEPWQSAVRAVLKACQKQGVRPGMFTSDGDDARRWLAAGFIDIVLSSDIAFLRRGLHQHMERARQPVTGLDPLAPTGVADPYAGR